MLFAGLAAEADWVYKLRIATQNGSVRFLIFAGKIRIPFDLDPGRGLHR